MNEQNEKIDVLIPAVEKDLAVLPNVIDGIRKHVQHPIGDIYIVAPDSEKIKTVCQEKQCTYIDENTILPVNKRRIFGAGWMLQQLLKLSCDTICSNNHFLVADADTILIAPHTFMHQNKTVFYCQDFYWDCKSIFEHFQRLTQLKPVAPRSLITHYMFINRKELNELKQLIESIHGKPWYQAILDVIDKRTQVPFSEFETYGNYMLIQHPDDIILTRAKNLDKSFSDFHDFHTFDLHELGKVYNSISFHHRK